MLLMWGKGSFLGLPLREALVGVVLAVGVRVFGEEGAGDAAAVVVWEFEVSKGCVDDELEHLVGWVFIICRGVYKAAEGNIHVHFFGDILPISRCFPR